MGGAGRDRDPEGDGFGVMKTVLVTGATSFIGLELVDKLHAQGCEVHIVTRPQTDPVLLQRFVRMPLAHVHDGSAAQLTTIVNDARPEITFHLAGRYVKEHDPADADALIRDNLTFGVQLLDALAAAGCLRLVNTGSYFQFASDGTPQPYNLYASLKSAFQDCIDLYRREHGLLATTLVLFDIYGPRERRRKLMTAIRDAVLNGTPLSVPKDDPEMDLVYAADAADAFVRAGALSVDDPSHVDGQRFAVSSGHTMRVRDVVALAEEVAGKKLDVRTGDWPAPKTPLPSPWRGAPVPGWKPETDLAAGIAQVLGVSS